MFKRCFVVMLPTKTKSNLVLNESTNKLHLCDDTELWGYQQLYVISDDDIKSGNYFYVEGNEKSHYHSKPSPYNKSNWYECTGVSNDGITLLISNGAFTKYVARKIIATTNDDLKVPAKDGEECTAFHSDDYKYSNECGWCKSDWSKCLTKLPQPSKAFIKVFMEAYNDGKPIREVMVEYEQICTDDFTSGCTQDKCNCEVKLKTDKNNNITIRKIKNSYSRDEVLKLLKDIYKVALEESKDEMVEYTYFDNWVEENLEKKL